MISDTAGRVVEIIWSVLAIGFGVFGLLFRERFLKNNASRFKGWYEKTHFFVFKSQSENMDSNYMRMVSTLAAIILVAVGLFTILSNF